MSGIELHELNPPVVPRYRYIVHYSQRYRRGWFAFQADSVPVGPEPQRQSMTEPPVADEAFYSVIAANEEHALRMAEELASSMMDAEFANTWRLDGGQ